MYVIESLTGILTSITDVLCIARDYLRLLECTARCCRKATRSDHTQTQNVRAKTTNKSINTIHWLPLLPAEPSDWL